MTDDEAARQDRQPETSKRTHEFAFRFFPGLLVTMFLACASTGHCGVAGCGFTRDYVGDIIDANR